jgi:hypothetical protein
MLNYWKHNWGWVFLVVVIGLVIWLVIGTALFQSCIGQAADLQATQSPGGALAFLTGPLRSYAGCFGLFLDGHPGAVTGLGALIIALFTALLWISTDRLWQASREATRVARLAADVATAAAEALPSVERAYLFFKETGNLIGNLPRNPGDESLCSVHPTFINLGKTPAILKSYRCGIITAEGAPTTSHVSVLPEQKIVARAIAASKLFGQALPIKLRGDWHPGPDPDPMGEQVYLIGLLIYDDVFGSSNVACFCWRLDWASAAFSEALDVPELNYERTIGPRKQWAPG